MKSNVPFHQKKCVKLRVYLWTCPGIAAIEDWLMSLR